MVSGIPQSPRYQHELEVALTAIRKAAAVVMEFYQAHSAETYTKGDGSPVTDADLAADKLLRDHIGTAFPNDGFLTEEGAQNLERRNRDRVWIIDPIDGTAQFIAGTGEFDIFIALAEKGRPVVAATMQPTTGLIHAAVKGEGAWRITVEGVDPLRTDTTQTPPRLVCSKYFRGREDKAMIDRIAKKVGAGVPPVLEVGFQSRAFDPSIRTYDGFIGLWNDPGQSAANEWDLAASDLIVNEAGGRFTDLWGRDLAYNKVDTHIGAGILVSASDGLHQELLQAIARELPTPAPSLDPADDMT